MEVVSPKISETTVGVTIKAGEASIRRTVADLETPTFKCVQNISRKNARGLFLGSMWLPKVKQAGLFSCFAFYRLLREAVCPLGGNCDAATSKGAAAISSSCSSGCGAGTIDQTIAMIRDRLTEIYSGLLQFPKSEFCNEQQHVLIAIQWAVKRFEIPQELFGNLLEGLRKEKDLRRFATRASLEQMGQQVGGSMATIAACVLGTTHSDAPKQSQHIGTAGYLAFLLRNLTTNLSNGRIQIPLEDLAKFKVTQNELQQGVVTEPIRALLQHQIDSARRLIAEGAKALPNITGDGSRLTAAWLATGFLNELDGVEKQIDQLLRVRSVLIPKMSWFGQLRKARQLRGT